MHVIATVAPMPPVDRTPPAEQIARALREDIRTERITPGAALPSIRRLAEEWGVSPPTALRVVKMLRDEGWIESHPGRPATVRHPD